MNAPLLRLTTSNSLLLVVDIQDNLLSHIPQAKSLVRNAGLLLDAASLLSIPVRATEQYPKGLGPTTHEIARRLPATIPAKTSFSCCGTIGLLAELRDCNRSNVILVGMEAHVCVLQTTLDLLEAGFQVILPVDALASRFALDQEIALRRLERAGALIVTTEMIVFEWVGDSTHPQFKAISKLVIERSNATN